jgi:hypothetical protein
MTESAAAIAPTAATEAPGSGVTVVPSLEERSAAAFGLSESAGDAGAPSDSPADAASPAVLAEPDAAAKARADRRAALDELKAKERQKVDAMAAIRERDELRKQLNEERERAKAYATHVDPSKLTKDQFFALAEKNPELTPQELGEWLRERMANPEAAAANAAKRAVDPEIAQLKQLVEQQQAAINSFMQSQQTAQEQAVERQAFEQFNAFTLENAATSPYSARFLERHGPEQFYRLVRSAAQAVPEHAGPQAILDEIEENLTQLGSIYQAAPAAAPQRRQANLSPTNQAAAKAPTHVTNTLAQQRSSVVDEDTDWAALTFEERSARLFR